MYKKAPSQNTLPSKMMTAHPDLIMLLKYNLQYSIYKMANNLLVGLKYGPFTILPLCWHF